MEFDDVDGETVSFDVLLHNAREQVLRPASSTTAAGDGVEVDWSRIAETNEAFKDVSKEAKKRGQLFGPVLVACDLLTQGFARCLGDATDGAGSGAELLCSHAEGTVLRSLAPLYQSLYESSPVPTRVAWEDEARAVFSGPSVPASALGSLQAELGPSRLAFVAPLVEALARAEHREDDVASEGDDGSFVEEQFKGFARRCLVLGRKCARGSTAAGTGLPATHIKEMNAVISSYISSGTLEW